MPSKDEVEALLKELDRVTADDLENQFIDFKEWDSRSRNQAIALILETVICLANGGGGTLVVGEIRESLRVLVGGEVLDVRRRGAATVWQLSPSTIRALRDDRSEPSLAPQSKFEVAQSQVLAWLHEAKGAGRLGIQSGELS